VTASTINRELRVMTNLLNTAREAGHIRAVPVIKMLDEKKDRRNRGADRETLNHGQVRALLDSADQSRNISMYLFVPILVYTGVRHGEATTLRWSDIDLNARIIHIRAKELRPGEYWSPKSENSVREIPINDDLFTILKEHQGDGWLFPSRQNRGRKQGPVLSLKKGFADVAEDAKLPEKVTAHWLRHTWASFALASGIDPAEAARIFGDRLDTFLNTYSHCIPGHAHQAMARFPSFAGGDIIPIDRANTEQAGKSHK